MAAKISNSQALPPEYSSSKTRSCCLFDCLKRFWTYLANFFSGLFSSKPSAMALKVEKARNSIAEHIQGRVFTLNGIPLEEWSKDERYFLKVEGLSSHKWTGPLDPLSLPKGVYGVALLGGARIDEIISKPACEILRNTFPDENVCFLYLHSAVAGYRECYYKNANELSLGGSEVTNKKRIQKLTKKLQAANE